MRRKKFVSMLLVATMAATLFAGCGNDSGKKGMSTKLTTLQYELMKLLSAVTNQGGSAEAMKNAVGAVTPTSVRAAATIITMLPIICIYPFLQKYFVTGLTLGGVKE